MTNNSAKVIGNLLSERSKFILIGLTGRTGSGCTTAASILEQAKPEYPALSDVKLEGEDYFQGLDCNRYNNIRHFAVKNHHKFFSIKVSDLISAYFLALTDAELIDFVASCSKQKLKTKLKKLVASNNFIQTKVKSAAYQSITKKLLNHNTDERLTDDELAGFFLYMTMVRKFTDFFKRQLNEIEAKLYLRAYQAAGNSIRRTGAIQTGFETAPFDADSIYHLPETVNKVVKLIRKLQHKAGKSCYVVIDAIRNPYEAKFFKDRYSAFYLVSINAPNADRKKYLQNVHKYSVDQFDELERKESGETEGSYADLISQNVKRCIEISDIHIFNPRKEAGNHNVLKAQLAWYVSLMQHPGLITPTALERVMQIAYTAKMNSGCISRQVGAVITDSDYSIKAVGWNDVPKGQVPCNLRSLDGLKKSYDQVTYSQYERNNQKFRDAAEKQLISFLPIQEQTGRPLSYCFKSLKNGIDSDKNQVHTRSLHAEENAFLQLTKYGGMGVQGGKLFTTASPCELCSKKAYQLGISEVVFIDPYPGIAIDHILSIGSNPPKLTQFRGAVGKGYHHLYEPLMPYKDELSYLAN
ncbi:MAG: anti-phage dCTP deaminase [Alishewanella aestuarii]